MKKETFIIAEAGVNHNGDKKLAFELIDVAAAARVDCVKFQTFIPEMVMSMNAPKAKYQKVNTGASESQIDMVRKLQLPFEVFLELKKYAESKHLLFLSTPFDYESADYLDQIGMSKFKIPSGEITNFPFLEHIGAKKKPVLLSTGMSTLDEVREAIAVLSRSGVTDLTLLHCVSMYPAEPKDTNLRAMATMERELKKPVGLSDHTPGIEISLAAVALGACVIEKHYTLNHNLPGPDHKASLEPEELTALVRGIRNIESALGTGIKAPVPSELDTAAVARRSLVAAQTIPANTVLKREMIAIKRPGTGLPPRRLQDVIGRKTKIAVKADELIQEEMLL